MSKAGDYDLVIIGRGAAAFAAAIRASEITAGQASIAMVGKGPLGGTCVNVGCVPSKYLIEAAGDAYRASRPRYPGFEAMRPKVDFARLMASLREAVASERTSKYEDVIAAYDNVRLVEGTASFTGKDEVIVRESGLRLKGYNFLIATGSRPKVPDVPGLREAGYLTSDTVWDLDALPQRLAIIGGGAVAVELGQALSRLGSSVTIFQRRPRLVPKAEPELSERLAHVLRSEGVRVELGAEVIKIGRSPSGKSLRFAHGGEVNEVEVDQVLVAAGRSPNVSELELERAGVGYSQRGVRVYPTMATSNPRIYAAGDVVDQGIMAEALAAKEGAIAAENIYDHAEKEIDLAQFPWSIFTDPQLASVGYAQADYPGTAEARLLDLSWVPRARIAREVEGAFKLVVDSSSRKVVGAHALAPNAGELISGAALAIKCGLTVEDLIDGPHVFPTISEGIKLAAQSFKRDLAKMSCCVERKSIAVKVSAMSSSVKLPLS